MTHRSIWIDGIQMNLYYQHRINQTVLNINKIFFVGLHEILYRFYLRKTHLHEYISLISYHGGSI